MKNKKDFCHSIFTETKALTSFCGTTQFGAKHPLIPYTDIYAPLLTGGDPVGHYSAIRRFSSHPHKSIRYSRYYCNHSPCRSLKINSYIYYSYSSVYLYC